MSIARLLGTTPHLSPLLRKARRLGYATVDDLARLARARGCQHYAFPDDGAVCLPECGADILSNAELAIALVSGGGDGEARHIRVAAQLMGAPDVSVSELSRLAIMERCVPVVRHIAEAGVREDEKAPDFWGALLRALPEAADVPEGRMPHPSRFMSQPGWSPASRPQRRASWLRAHG